MITFGKYKGKSLMYVFEYDKPYFVWMANNIPNIDSRLDKEDRTTLFRYAFPYKYIEQKYGDIWHKMDEDSIIKILKDEKYVLSAFSYINVNETGVNGNIETVYGSTFGSSVGMGDIDATHYDIIGGICKHFDKANKWFKEYISNIK